MNETTNEKLALMYDMARSAKASGDATTAKKYYDMILDADPLNWEPVFYSVYYTYATMKNGEIGNKASEIRSCLSTALLMVEKIADEEEKNKALLDLKQSVVDLGIILLAASENFYKALPFSTKNPYDKSARTVLIGDLVLTMGEGLQRNQLVAAATETFKHAISIFESEFFFSSAYREDKIPAQIAPYHGRIAAAANYIRESEPDYKTKREQNIAAFGEKKGCYVATCVYGSYDCPEVWTLRRYRDDTLGASRRGRAFIRFYYAVSPTLVKWFGKTKWFKKLWRGKLDKMVKKLQSQGVASTPYCDKEW